MEFFFTLTVTSMFTRNWFVERNHDWVGIDASSPVTCPLLVAAVVRYIWLVIPLHLI